MTDARFQFGALGAWQADEGPIEFGFWFPGRPRDTRAAAERPRQSGWIRRYHPIAPGVAAQLPGEFSLRAERIVPRRDARRLAMGVEHVEAAGQLHRRRTDAPRACWTIWRPRPLTIDGRTAIPFVLNTMSDELQWNWTMVAMGFVGKNIECADQLLREGDRDQTERGQKMRQTGLAIIASMIQALPTVPLQGTGYDLTTGKPWEPDHDLAGSLAAQRHRRHARADARLPARARPGPAASGMVQLGEAVRGLADPATESGRLVSRGAGSAGSNEVAEPTGTTSYNPVPLLVADERRDRRPEVQAVGDPRGGIRLVELGNAGSLHRRRHRQSEYHRQRGRDAQHGSLPESL